MMISINLLPHEFRKRERTPVIIFLPIIIGLACVLSAVAATAYVHFAWLTEAQNEHRRFEGEFAQRAGSLKYEERLLAEELEYKKRSDTIRGIAASRTLMTRKLDQLCDVVLEGDKDQSYLVWLDQVKVAPPKATSAGTRAKPGETLKAGGDLSLKGLALADRDPLQHYNRFHAAIKAAELFRECISLENPDGKIQEFNDDRSPKKGWSIDLVLTMLHPTEVAKIQAKAKTESQMAEKTAGDSKAKR